jgi:hypothetical protein
MTSLLNFHAFATTRGEGLRPELRALLERVAAAPRFELTVRNDGMIQSGPDPISEKVSKERGNVSLFLQPLARQTDEANQRQDLTEEQFLEQFAALEEGLALLQIHMRGISENAKHFGSLARQMRRSICPATLSPR